MKNPAHQICDRVAEAQALLDDHRFTRRYSDAELIRKLYALFSEQGLMRRMYEVGYFPPDTPPPVITGADA